MKRLLADKRLLPVILCMTLMLPAFLFGCADEPIDLSNASNGTITAHTTFDTKTKLVVHKGEEQYAYTLPEDGSSITVPLNLGDGEYQIEIFENIEGARYTLKESKSLNVSGLENKPYLSSNLVCTFSPVSSLVKQANSLCEGLSSDSEKVDAISSWVVDNISYDETKAKELAGGKEYFPVAEATFISKKGICFDYASLTAAMLRSQNIPTKIVVGTYLPTGEYHSWNEVLVDGEYIPIDPTFAAGSNDPLVIDSNRYRAEKRY